MLSDDERAALNLALEKFIAEKNAHDGVVNPVTLYSEAMFAAGIAYAQTQQAAMIAQARAEEREACAKVCDELARTQRETNDKYPMHALAYPQWRERISYYEQCATAIRARKDGQ